ncbi:MAG: xylan 1,4-beta-xylosidase, partial [Patiriisocius sp.]
MSRADGIDLTIEATTETTKFDRYFSKCIGSCHAYLTLREDYRQHVRAVQKEIGFRNIRCHGIFHDWVGVCHDGNDGLTFNFQNVDKIYDFFLEVGLKPYVELGFMPKLLASDLSKFTFRYEANISPPRNFQLWNELVSAFVRHLVQRYGIEEVTEWYFEV